MKRTSSHKDKLIGICGHFDSDEVTTSGQVIKTRTVFQSLASIYGKDKLVTLDTVGGIKKIPILVGNLRQLSHRCENIIILPAENGLKVLAPVLFVFNKRYQRKLHYVVIGGWLPDYLKKNSWLIPLLKKFTGIYVETNKMKLALENNGFNNIFIMPNFKNIQLLDEDELVFDNTEPFKLCTFSRVMKEKGIEDAINAVEFVNNRLKRTVYTLDIYGQIDKGYIDRFNGLIRNFPEYICYKGVIPFNKSTNVLKNYFALLFPTYYDGEGLAGTLIDALCAGVPVIASDWKYNSEFIKQGYNGLLIRPHDEKKLAKTLEQIATHKEDWNGLKVNCIKSALKYSPENSLENLAHNINE